MESIQSFSQSNRFFRFSNSFICLIFPWVLCCSGNYVSGQDRPPTEQLLPETTVFLLQIDNWKDFYLKAQQLPFGQMLNDQSVAPLIDNLWEEAEDAFQADAGQELGVSLSELSELPNGEITIAVVAPRRKDPEFILIFETDPESDTLERLVDYGYRATEDQGETTDVEDNDDFELEKINFDGRPFTFFRRDGLLVGSTSKQELDDLIDRWMGREVEKVRPLARNRKFITIMNRCRGSRDLPAEVRFFVDPIELARSATRGDIGSQIVINLLPTLGLDGLLGIGGSLLLSEDEFSSVTHLHILLAEPRQGIFQMLAFRPTDYQPEPWIPEETINYFTTSWDVPVMLSELTKMIDMIQDEGTVDRFFDFLDEQVEFDVREDFLGNLSGRMTFSQWVEEPITTTSQQSILSFGVKDVEAMEELLEKIYERIIRDIPEDSPFGWQVEDYQGVSVYSMREEGMAQFQRRRFERENERRIEDGREPFETQLESTPTQTSFALVGEYLIVSPQTRSAIITAIDTDQGRRDSLSYNEDFRRINDKLYQSLRSDLPSAITYSNPRHVIGWLFDLASSENSQDYLAERGQESEFLGRFKDAWDKNPLPNFSEVERYLQPQGGFMTSDETGLHFMFFELK